MKKLNLLYVPRYSPQHLYLRPTSVKIFNLLKMVDHGMSVTLEYKTLREVKAQLMAIKSSSR